MAPAPATSPRRRTSSSSPRRTWLYVAGGAVLLVVLLVVLRRRSSSNPTLDSSGTPGPDQTGSSVAPTPTGGAGSVPGNLPPLFVSQPDQVQQQVQQTDASGSSSQSATTAAAATTAPVVYTGPGGQALVDPSLPYLAPVPYLPSHPGVVGGAPQINEPALSNIHRPGQQILA